MKRVTRGGRQKRLGVIVEWLGGMKGRKDELCRDHCY